MRLLIESIGLIIDFELIVGLVRDCWYFSFILLLINVDIEGEESLLRVLKNVIAFNADCELYYSLYTHILIWII